MYDHVSFCSRKIVDLSTNQNQFMLGGVPLHNHNVHTVYTSHNPRHDQTLGSPDRVQLFSWMYVYETRYCLVDDLGLADFSLWKDVPYRILINNLIDFRPAR
jgi:hypothetical protein